MNEDFGWSGDEFLMGDCREDWNDLGLAILPDDLYDQGVDSDEDDEWLDDYEAGVYPDGESDAESDFDDDPMDGDAGSALASCGWGMDEDYGGGWGGDY